MEQPTKYMVDSIRAKDEEIDSLRAAQGKLSAKLSALERACRWDHLSAPSTVVSMRFVRFFLSSGFMFVLDAGRSPRCFARRATFGQAEERLAIGW